jgi:hypothetical protein
MDYAASCGASRKRAKQMALNDAENMLRRVDRELAEAQRLERSASPLDRRVAEVVKDNADDLLRQADAAVAAANRL